jgi:alpha-amylase/alpha-mannosidase (GH57 family)
MPGHRAIAIHGHFYQPPRENPWLEAVEVQDSAAPYHDWNERVTAECYAPNTAARLIGRDDRILGIVNNFEKISCNVGPTLCAWLERHAPGPYARILEADRLSAAAHGGHGNAIAQVYNHMIMPLASPRDRVTQVHWGIADFRHRFGRDPEGMWLPETAVDTESLEVLADAGLAFTILAPHQAWRVREQGTEAWTEVGDRIDPSRPYLWRGRRGQRLALFFYDGPISRAIAFEGALDRAEHLVARLRGGFSEGRTGPQLVHCATDGESYGHHKSFGDMALAAALQQIQAAGFARLTNYGTYLAAHPPTHQVEIRERTSWSCAHGVERWRGDCGCRMRPDWHQRWRRPLREALDWLRDQLDLFYEARASGYLKDPWEARDRYIDVVLDRSPERVAAFLDRVQRVPLDAAARVDVRRLLELQRNRMLMYTSCGWFFDELSALEPVQILKYAAIAMQYLRDLSGGVLEPEFIRRLEAAPTNVREFGNGGDVYRRLIRPAVVDWRRVVAHYAITGMFEEHADDRRVYAWRVQRLEEVREAYNGTAMRVARVRVTADMTGDVREGMYAVLHFGGHDFTCGIRTWEDHATWEALQSDLLRRYAQHSMADMVRGLDEYFPRETFALRHLFIEERRRVLGLVIRAVLDKHEETYRRIWEESRKLVRYLREVEAPIPEVFRITAQHVLEEELVRELRQTAAAGAIPERAFDISAEAAAIGLTLDLAEARPVMRQAVHEALAGLREAPSPEGVAAALALLDGARRLGVRFGRWVSQNEFFELWQARPDARPILGPLAVSLGFALEDRAAP